MTSESCHFRSLYLDYVAGYMNASLFHSLVISNIAIPGGVIPSIQMVVESYNINIKCQDMYVDVISLLNLCTIRSQSTTWFDPSRINIDYVDGVPSELVHCHLFRNKK